MRAPVGQTGHAYQWQVELNSQMYPIAVGKDGLPQWVVDQVPEVATRQPMIVAEEQEWKSWHNGFGFRRSRYNNTYWLATGIDARFPGMLILGPAIQNSSAATGDIVGFFEQSSNVYCLDAGGLVRQLTFTWGSASSADSVALSSPNTTGGSNGRDFSGAAPSSAINFDGVTVVGFSSNNFIQKFDGTTWTASTTQKGVYFAKFWQDSYFAIAASVSPTANNSIVYSAQNVNPTGAAWLQGPFVIGETTTTINAIVASEKDLYIAKTDGLYGFDRGLRTPLKIRATAVSSTNGVGTFADSGGRVWYPTSMGLFRYDSNSGVVEDVSPAYGADLRDNLIGGLDTNVVAITQWRGWYYAAVYNGTNSYIMVGRDRHTNEEGINSVVWHGSIGTIAGKVLTMVPTTLTTYPVMLVGSDNNRVYFWRLSATENPIDDSNYLYTGSGILYESFHDWNLPGARWQYLGAAIDTVAGDSDNQIALGLAIDDDTSTWITPISVTGVTGRTYSSYSASEMFSSMLWRITHTRDATDLTASSPIIHSVTLQAARRVNTRDLIQTTIICDDRYLSTLGVTTREDAKTMITNLKALSNAAPVTLIDFWTGSSRSQTVLVMPPKQVMIRQEGYDAAIYAVQISMRVLA